MQTETTARRRPTLYGAARLARERKSRRERARRERAENPEALREANRRYRARHPESLLSTAQTRARAAARQRANYAANPEKYREIARRYRKRHPLKDSARKTLCLAVRRGKIARPDCCSRCAKPCRPQGHHPSHDRPLDVVWLCRDCHFIEHHPNARIDAPKQSKASQAA